MTAECTKCHLELPLEQFRIRSDTGRRRTDCIQCQNNRCRQYRQENLEKLREYDKQRAPSVDRKLAAKDYRERNRGALALYQANYRQAFPDKVIALRQKRKSADAELARKWRKANKDRINSRHNYRYHNDEQFRLRILHSKRVCQALKKSKKSKQSFINEVGCDISQLRLHIESLFAPDMNWKNYGSVWEVDHIQPLSSFDLLDSEQAKKAFHYSNLRPLLKQENRIKGKKLLK